jgi:hypothetical protein
MKYLPIYLTLVMVLFGAASASAQTEPPPPPPPAPDYFPERWKEYVYENDGVKVRFPAEPKISSSVTKEPYGEVTTRKYHHQSFVTLDLSVTELPPDVNLETLPSKELLEKMKDGGLSEVKELNPRIVKESDVTVDGYPAKFMQVETGDGKIVRCKFFVVKNRMYFMSAEVKKGERHGLNYENDFEKVAMGFLDSIKLLSPKK